MSSDSEDDGIKRSRSGDMSVVDKFANISDDDSDDGRLRNVRTPTPPPDDDDIKGTRSDSDGDERRKSSDDEDGYDDDRSSKRVLDAHERRVLKRKHASLTVDLLHFPPTLEVGTVLATHADVPENQAYPMAFRAARSAPADVPRALLQALQRGPLNLCDVLESNARLVEWADGSRTVMVGDEHYSIIGDRLASDYYLFRKGEDVQTFEASIASVGRLQPCDLGGMSASIAKAQTPGIGRKEARTIMRTMKEGGEQEEKLAKEEADRKERDRARRESKRRASMGSQPRTQDIASPAFDESDAEPSDDEAERIADEQERLAKRRRSDQFSFQTRKAGGRRVVNFDDEEDSDDDDE